MVFIVWWFVECYLWFEIDMLFNDCVVDFVNDGFDLVVCIGELVDMSVLVGCKLGV